jgi:aspartate carbamoyltransferase
VERVGYSNLLQGKLMASLFYEPSTRTSSSFIAAMSRLGGAVVPINEVVYSSVTKGESLPDTVRTLESYTDVIVLRHPEVGSAAIAAHYCEKPIINAGDGVGEHPTQALLDIFTIEEDHQRVDGLSVAMVGDLKYGRTVHSLTRLLSLFNVKFYFVSPEILRMPSELIEEFKQKGIEYEELEDVSQAIDKADVLYVTRVQKERFADLAQYDAMKDFYTITPELMKNAKQTMSVMHPLPRVGEISYAVDADPRASYFRQMKNGMYVRMALLTAVLGRA